MDAPHARNASHGRVLLGTVGIAVLATLCGIGGPPSILRQGLPPWLRHSAQYLIAVYVGGLLFAVVAVFAAAVVPRIGRLFGTGAAILTTLGNVLSALVGSGGEGRGAALFSLLLVPFVLLMWAAPPNRNHLERPVA